MIEANPPYIRTTSDFINPQTTSLDLLFAKLENELKNSKVPGIGLTAVQIGIFKRAAIIRTKDTTLNLWNSQILEGEGTILFPESCLSLPGRSRTIARSEQVTIGNGDGRKYILFGLDAVVAQHEIDHMNGITILSRPMRTLKVGRNELCPCGSKKKFKKCHIENPIELQRILVNDTTEK